MQARLNPYTLTELWELFLTRPLRNYGITKDTKVVLSENSRSMPSVTLGSCCAKGE